MQTTEALYIVRALSTGANPRTGEVYPPDSPFQNVEIARALMLAVRALERLVEAERKRRALPPNGGNPWTEEEESVLVSSFDSGKSMGEIARELKRTSGAIRARLIKLGKIEDDSGYSVPWIVASKE